MYRCQFLTAFIFNLFVFSYYNSVAQEYTLKSIFSEENVLPGNFINSTACDNDGKLWFTCAGKLMSYDGILFKRHTYSLPGYTSTDSKVEVVFKNSRGEIIFFDRKNYYTVLKNQKITIRKNYNSDVHFSIHLATEDFTNHRALFEYKLSRYQLINLIRNQKNGYLINERFIRYFNNKTKIIDSKVATNSIDYPSGFAYHSDYITLFYKTGNLQLRNGKITRRNIPISLNDTILKNPQIYKVFNSGGTHFLWMKTNGLYEIKEFGDTIRISRLIDGSLLPDDDIISIEMVDARNAILIACRSKGLFQYCRMTFKGFTHPFKFTSSFNSILKVKNYIYTNNGIKWDIKTHRPTPSFIHFSNYGCDYIEDSIHQKKYFLKNTTVVAITDSGAYPDIKSNDHLYYCSGAIYKNKVYGWNRNAFFILENNRFKLLKHKLAIRGAYNVHSIAVHDDTMWVGTTDRAYAYRLGVAEPVYSDLFKGTSVRSIKVDPHKRGILFFTYGNGVYLYTNGKFYAASTNLTENLNFTHYMFIDKFNRVWLATNKGMYCTDYEEWFQSFLHPETVPYIYQFSKSDGLIANELNGGTSHSLIFDSTSGIAYLSSIAGLNIFRPNTVQINFPSQPIRFEETYLDDSLIYDLDSINHPFSNIKFKVSSAYYGNNENLKFEYRVANQSTLWRPLNNQNEFYFTRKNPGEQTVEIRYRNGFGKDQYNIATLRFTIPPLWHEKTSYQTLIIISILILFWLIMRTRVQIQKKKQTQLKKIIEEQTQNLRKTLEDLMLSEDNLRTSDSIKEKLIRVLAHDIRSPMISTIYLSNHIRSQLQSFAKSDLKSPIQLLGNVIESQNNILNYANDFLAWYNVSHGFVEPAIADVNLHNIIEPILRMYAPIIEINNNKLVYSGNKNVFVRTDSSFLNIIVRNLVDNANKNTRNGTIEIQFLDNGDSLTMLIRNDTKDCDPASLENMKNKMNLETEDDYKQLKLGLTLIKSLSKHINLPLTCIIDDKTVSVNLQFKHFTYAITD